MNTRLAVILAAGMGTRLAGLNGDAPKGFLRVGGRAIIDASLDRLVAAGVERFILVTGYSAGYYRAWAAARPEAIVLVHNSIPERSGSLYSLALAAPSITEDFLLLESDLVYENRALTAVRQHPAADVILASGPTDSGDEVYISTDPRGMLRDMSKDVSLLHGEPWGELVGISRLTPAALQAVTAAAGERLAADPELHYETDGLVAAAAAGFPFACHRVDDLAWSEIDTAEHLERARSLVLPRLDAPGEPR